MTASAMSLNEQWLWLVERLTPGSITRTTATLGRRIRGPLDPDRLRRCITELIRRHETLRTTFVIEDGRLRRVESADPEPGWIWRDFTSEPAGDRERLALEFMDEERKKQIDITAGPQTRCMLARISRTEHLMLFATHHMAADAASLVLLEEELSTLYAQDAAASPEPATGPYSEFIEWQDRTLRANPEESVSHWTNMIAQAKQLDLDRVLGPASHPVPRGYTMTVVPKGHRDRQQVALGPELSVAVRALATSSRCSLFMVLVAGLQLTLYLRSGTDSFLVRTPTANRGRREHQELIGALETQTFVRCEAESGRTFTDMLQAIRTQVLQGLRYQAVPMSMILGSALQRGAPASKDAACGGSTVQFALFSHGRMANWPAGLDVIVCAGGRIGTPSDFQVFAMEEGRRLDGAAPGIILEANNPGGAYTGEDVHDFLAAFRDVLAAAVASPGLPVAEFAERFPSLSVPATAPAGPSEPEVTTAPGAGTLEERLLAIAREACADDGLTAGRSVVTRPDTAVETMVKLVDAINRSGVAAGTGVTLADIMERPAVADLAVWLADRARHRPVAVG